MEMNQEKKEKQLLFFCFRKGSEADLQAPQNWLLPPLSLIKVNK